MFCKQTKSCGRFSFDCMDWSPEQFTRRDLSRVQVTGTCPTNLNHFVFVRLVAWGKLWSPPKAWFTWLVVSTSPLLYRPYKITSHVELRFFFFVAFKDWHYHLCMPNNYFFIVESIACYFTGIFFFFVNLFLVWYPLFRVDEFVSLFLKSNKSF